MDMSNTMEDRCGGNNFTSMILIQSRQKFWTPECGVRKINAKTLNLPCKQVGATCEGGCVTVMKVLSALKSLSLLPRKCC